MQSGSEMLSGKSQLRCIEAIQCLLRILQSFQQLRRGGDESRVRPLLLKRNERFDVCNRRTIRCFR